MNCPKCGFKLKENQSICEKCGFNLKADRLTTIFMENNQSIAVIEEYILETDRSKMEKAAASLQENARRLNEGAARVVMELINQIPNASFDPDFKSKIDDARSAYDRLIEEQKTLITNYDLLLSAEENYKTLQAHLSSVQNNRANMGDDNIEQETLEDQSSWIKTASREELIARRDELMARLEKAGVKYENENVTEQKSIYIPEFLKQTSEDNGNSSQSSRLSKNDNSHNKSDKIDYRHKMGKKTRRQVIIIWSICIILCICILGYSIYKPGAFSEIITKSENEDQKNDSTADEFVQDNTTREELLPNDTIITFGSYEQDNNPSNGAEPIEWIVLKSEGKKALVISKYALDCQPYNYNNEDVTWETCSLRTWLNTEFLDNAFNPSEQQAILSTLVTNPDIGYMYSEDTGKDHVAEGGNDTEDKLFLANDNYFSSRANRYCVATEYAIAMGVHLTGDTFNGLPICWWWLRSPGGGGQNTVRITDGHISETYASTDGTWDHEVNQNDCGVRPEMWITLSGISPTVLKRNELSDSEGENTIGASDDKIVFSHENYYTENDNCGRNWVFFWLGGAVHYDENSQTDVPVELEEGVSKEEILDTFWGVLEEDPAMFAACEGYVDTVLGTGNSGEYGCGGENYLKVMNNNAQKYYSDYELWDEHLQTLKEMFTSAGTVTIEYDKDSYNRLGMMSTDAIPEIILMDRPYEGGHLMVITINIKGTEFKLKFLLETGYAPVDVEAWKSPKTVR